MPNGDGYLAAAYLVFVALILIYLVIMGIRLSRLERELTELDDAVARRQAAERDRQPAGVE